MTCSTWRLHAPTSRHESRPAATPTRSATSCPNRASRGRSEGGVPLFGWRTRYWGFLLKLAKRLPAWTIQAQPGTAIGPFHWNSRRLTAVELCRLQTLPDDIGFDCGRTHLQRMIGNAVPSLLAEVLALEIRSQLLGTKRRSSVPKLLPAVRVGCPPPELTLPIAKQYQHLIGQYADHPGPGRGPGNVNLR